jgi:anti-sigma factor ChrR (cupin superfamily)
MKTLVKLFDQLNWEEADNYPEGTYKKTLRDEDGARTIMLKLPAGFRMPPHSHLTTEQNLVLTGAFTYGGKTYQEGDYLLYRAQEEHGPFYSKDGALVLVIWDPYEQDK